MLLLLHIENIAVIQSADIQFDAGFNVLTGETGAGKSIVVDALNAGQLAGAALDVFVQEPIPDGDPIWDAKNLLLTPHVSGQLSLGYTRDKNVALFCEDLENYAAGRPLARYVDRKIGY